MPRSHWRSGHRQGWERVSREPQDRATVTRAGTSWARTRSGRAEIEVHRSHLHRRPRSDQYRRDGTSRGGGRGSPMSPPSPRLKPHGALRRRTQRALFLTNYPSPVPGLIYEPGRAAGAGARPPRARARSTGRRAPSSGALSHLPPSAYGAGPEKLRLLRGHPRTALPEALQAGKGLRTPPHPVLLWRRSPKAGNLPLSLLTGSRARAARGGERQGGSGSSGETQSLKSGRQH